MNPIRFGQVGVLLGLKQEQGTLLKNPSNRVILHHYPTYTSWPTKVYLVTGPEDIGFVDQMFQCRNVAEQKADKELLNSIKHALCRFLEAKGFNKQVETGAEVGSAELELL
jgi:hypothetical protein